MTDYKITGSPDEIWLNYGDIERDDTHQNCARDGEVTWCEEAVFYSDIKYVRADLIEALRQQLAAKQAEVDALMLEYCPNEMTPEQLEEWGRNQVPVKEQGK